MQFPQLRAPTGSTPCKVNKKDGQPRLTVLTCFGGPSGGQPAAQAAAAAPRRLARYAGKCLRISSAPRSDGFDPMKGQQKSDQPKPVALQCFGGPSGGRTLDLGIKSLERDVMECLVAAKSQVVMFPHSLTALKLHCRTDIDGYPAMHKAPPRQFMPGRGCIYQFLKSFWLPTRTIAHPRRPVSSPAAAPTIKQISNGFICTPIDRVA